MVEFGLAGSDHKNLECLSTLTRQNPKYKRAGYWIHRKPSNKKIPPTATIALLDLN